MTLINEYGGLSRLIELKSLYDGKNILLVTGKRSFRASGAEQELKRLFHSQKVVQFMDFDVNPKITDAMKGAEIAREHEIGVIISVGGGSVIDMAKLIKACYRASGNEIALAKGTEYVDDPSIPMMAIPTTAGSGSEVTHFAVVYVGAEKYSLASQHLLPDAVILDGALVQSGSRYLKTCNVLDAMAQAVESYWAVGATNESRKFAHSALELGWTLIPEFISERCSTQTAQRVIEAANLAGKAINISKTTAAHAWSYAFTSSKGIPHGHAVWLTLPQIFKCHYMAVGAEVIDTRGPKALKETMELLIDLMGLEIEKDLAEQLKYWLTNLGVETEFEPLGITSKADRLDICNNVNMERLGNNPVNLSRFKSQIFNL